jgi:hypothetical protein
MDITSIIDIDKIKEKISEEMITYISDLFPDGKIPLYISPISDSSDNYIKWSEYSSEGPLSGFDDNYCRADETGSLFYPTLNEDLQPCDSFFSSEITSLIDLNEIIYNSIATIKLDTEVENRIESEKVHNELNEKLDEYTKVKTDLYQEEKTLTNLQNISSVINNLNNQLNKNNSATQNQVNINKDTIEEEKYRYAPNQYYIYSIVVLIVIIFIIHFTVLYY